MSTSNLRFAIGPDANTPGAAEVVYDQRGNHIEVNGTTIRLSPTEDAIIASLCEARGRFVKREDLVGSVRKRRPFARNKGDAFLSVVTCNVNRRVALAGGQPPVEGRHKGGYRLQARLVRAIEATKGETGSYRLGNLSMDVATATVEVDGKPVKTMRNAAVLLAVLAAAGGRFVHDAELLEGIYPDPRKRAGHNMIHVLVHHLRKAIRAAGGPDPVMNQHGRGHAVRLVEEPWPQEHANTKERADRREAATRTHTAGTYTLGSLSVDAATATVLVDGQPARMPRNAALLLAVLMAAGGRFLGDDEILDGVYPATSRRPKPTTIHVLVHQLRTAVREAGGTDPVLVRHGIGHAIRPVADAAIQAMPTRPETDDVPPQAENATPPTEAHETPAGTATIGDEDEAAGTTPPAAPVKAGGTGFLAAIGRALHWLSADGGPEAG